MRKAQKQQAEDFVKLLGQAHDEIKKAIEKRNISAALSLLADCQDGAIALGELIEKAEGEGTVTIALLESYCEQVYRLYEELEKGQPVGAGKASKSLRQMLFKIESSVKNDIKVRTEVVFLPYKASMWDSLESIWKAADEDPDCDAYVIPIPYYDKNPDGSFKERHYEGGEYPKNVPVVWYEDYDFEKRRPDMVFIHNPYDDYNLVTSVHPDFYSPKLKKFTDKLVYVPYFILGEIDPEDRQALKGIEKFCLLPGVVYADQVIVQSEDMRQAYINILTEFMSGQGRSREYWEKKILGLGSPKIDKALNTRKEDLEIPEEWMKIILKPDGSWKKIIFYNTTVTALLQHNGQYLEKMRDVFRIFYENRDEVVLLWRPHPLFMSTIESMRAELRDAYQEIVREYRRAGWGIYDDTADMDRAVCVSDGYYGDLSSVIWLYQKLKKPIMMQNAECVHDSFIPNDSVHQEKNEVWFIGNRDNILYHMNLLNQNIEPLVAIPTESSDTFRITPRCIKYRDSIICLPDRGKKICTYDLCTRQMKEFSVNNPNGIRLSIFNYWIEENILWCVSYGLNQIIEFELEGQKNPHYYNLAVNEKDLLGYGATKNEEYIYCVFRTSTTLCEFNTKLRTCAYYTLPIDEKGLNTVACIEGSFWLTGYNQCIYVWNKLDDTVKTLHDFPSEFGKYRANYSQPRPIFYHSMIAKRNIILFPWYRPILIVDRSNFNMKCLTYCDSENCVSENYTLEYAWNGKSAILCSQTNKIYELNNEGEFSEKSIFNIIDMYLFESKLSMKKDIFFETNKGYLDSFLKESEKNLCENSDMPFVKEGIWCVLRQE